MKIRSTPPGRTLQDGLCVLLACLLTLAGPAPVFAQTSAGSLTGRTLDSVEVRGLETLSEETILFYLNLEPGMVLSEIELNEKVRDLWTRKLIDDISIEAEPGEQGGVHLVVNVSERATLLSIDYEEMKRINASDVTDRILKDDIEVLEGSPLSRGELERVKAAIEELYQEKGYRFAEASYRLEEVEPNEYRVVFTVDEGDRVRIADVQFVGNDVIGDLRLQWAMKNTKETNLLNRIMKKDIYKPATFEEDLERVREVYREKGYKNVTLGEPEIDVRAKRPDAPTSKKMKRRMFIEIPVIEGERWRLGEITIDGNDRFSDQQLLRAFETRSGSWLRSKKIDEAIETINDVYANNGFIFARVQPELREQDGADNVADLLVEVEEGEQFTVRRIEFEGNTRTRDKVLRRELRVQEGYIMNTGALRSSVFKVNQLGYFQLEQEEPVAIDVDNEDKKVDLVFKGTEADRTELQFGGGWSETFGFEGQFGLRTRNFLGRGETLSAQVQRGRIRDLIDLSYFIPWFLDRPQTIGLRVFDLEFDQFFGTGLTDGDDNPLDDISRQQRGATFTYGRSLRLFQQVSLALTRSELEDFFFVPTEDGFDSVPFARSFASLQPTWLYDSRDSRFEPTRGLRLLGSVEFSGGFLGGDTDFVKPQVQASYFKPLSRTPFRTVFAVNAESGYIDLDETSLISPLDRFFLGGENSIRGHAFRSITVRDDDGNLLFDPRPGFGQVPLGGDTFFQLNLEYHVLLGGPLRVLAFLDAGNVYSDEQGFDISNLRETAGLEMRLLLPVFGAPLRFIYAFNLDELPNDDFETFQFNIGTSF